MFKKVKKSSTDEQKYHTMYWINSLFMGWINSLFMGCFFRIYTGLSIYHAEILYEKIALACDFTCRNFR